MNKQTKKLPIKSSFVTLDNPLLGPCTNFIYEIFIYFILWKPFALRRERVSQSSRYICMKLNKKVHKCYYLLFNVLFCVQFLAISDEYLQVV